MSYACREAGSRVNVHELDHVPFCSFSAGFKCFHCISLLSCAFGGKATRLPDSLQAEQFSIYLWKQSLLCSIALKIIRKRIFLLFFPKAIQVLSQLCQSVSAAVSVMPFLQSTEMAQLKALLPVKGRKRSVQGAALIRLTACMVCCI